MRGFIDFLVTNFGVYFESGSEIFLWFFNRAVAASWLILAVIVLRLLLKKAPKWITCALWGICALRLVLPFSLQSALSLIPSAQTVVPETIYDNRPQIDSGIPIIDENINAQITEQYFEGVTVPQGATLSFTSIIAIIWMLGIIALLTYAVVSYIKLKRRVKGANMLEKGVFESVGVSSPFILGIFNPKIYLPLDMDVDTKTYVLSHEKAHLSRGDHILKPLGFVILSLYWFSPLVWLAYILFCRDIELACDEKVVSKLEKNSRADYAQALLSCAAPKKSISACPLAFGEVSIKDRVKSALSYKKPMLWVIIAAVITAIVVSICFVTDPISKKNLALVVTDYNSEVSGINLSLSSADVNSEKPCITVKWYNDSDSEFTYGESFLLKRYKNGEYVSCAKGELFFHEIAYMLSPKSSGEHTYYLDSFNISKAGKYRFETGFNGEFTIDFSLTKTSKEEKKFTDLTTDNAGNSVTSNDTLKDETSSLPVLSDKEDISSQNGNNSIVSKDEVSSGRSEDKEINSKLQVQRPVSSNTETSSTSPLLESDFPFIMPKDNPEPISIHRADAATPTEFSYTDFAGGEEMKYNVRTALPGIYYELSRKIAIIRNHSELQSVHDLDFNGGSLPKDGKYADLYDENFFANKSLVMIFLSGSSGDQYEVNTVLKEEDQMCIYLKQTKYGLTNDYRPWRIFIEIDKADLEEIKTAVVYFEKYKRNTETSST